MNVPHPAHGMPQGGQQPPSSAPASHGASGGRGAAGSGPVESLYPLASWKSRVYARGIDLVLVALPALLLALVLSLAWVGLQAIGSGTPEAVGTRYRLFLSVVFFLLYTGYEVFALSRWQQTLGKRRAGLKIAPVAGTGRLGPLPFAALAARAALLALPFLLLFVYAWMWWLLVIVIALLTGGMAARNRPNRQGLHDKIAGTVVLDVGVHDPAGPSAPSAYPPHGQG